MNLVNKIIVFLLILIMNIGCGTDGSDGEVFVRFRAVLEPTNFTIDNSDIPIDLEYDVYYKTSSGSYPFSYVDHNDVQHPLPGEYGVLEILADSGDEGGLFSSGDDGRDIYVDLILLSTGAIVENFNYYTVPSELNYEE